jgi:hypothetical protein
MSPEATDAPPSAAPHAFYARAVDDAAMLVAANAVHGFDEELAMLRVTLEEHMRKFPGDLELLIKGARLVAQMVASRYRMSPARTDEFFDTLATVTKQIAEQLYPERFDDV